MTCSLFIYLFESVCTLFSMVGRQKERKKKNKHSVGQRLIEESEQATAKFTTVIYLHGSMAIDCLKIKVDHSD